MPLAGSIESFGISEILQLISQQGKTGTLSIDVADGAATLRFREGKLIEAWPDKRGPAELVGTLLVRSGLISPVQLEHALQLQRQNLRRIGDILIRMGAVRIGDFQEILSLQHRETVYKLLKLKRGKYQFATEPVDIEEGVSVPMDVGTLLMEGFRQIDEWPALLEKIPSERQVFARCAQDTASPDLGGEETKALSLIDGVATVREIVDRCRLGEFGGWAALSGLLTKDLITPVGVSAPPRASSPRRRRSSVLSFALDTAVGIVLLAFSVSLIAFAWFTGGSTTRGIGTGLREMRGRAEIASERSKAWPGSLPGPTLRNRHTRQ